MSTLTRTEPAVEPVPSHPGRHVLEVVVGLALLLSLLVAAFALPAVNAAPRDLPLGLSGPPPATAQLGQLLTARQPGAFAVTTFPDEPALRSAIRDRDVYGGLAVGTGAPRLLVASAASPAVAAALTSLGQAVGQSQGVTLVPEDVVPLPAADPHGAALATALLPVLIGGIAPVVLLVRLVRRRGIQVLGVLLSNVATGFAVIAVLHVGMGALTGSYLLESLALFLLLAAISTTLLGLYAVARWEGFGAGVLTMVLLGLPLSGVQSAPELLPGFWATVGQALPPGAGGRLLRSAAYFDGRGATTAVLVLACWLGAGLLACWLGRRDRRDRQVAPA